MNSVKVFVLLAGLVALFGVVGGMLGGQTGMLLALVIAAAMSGFMYFNSGKMALRAYQAKVVSREQAPEIYEIVDRLRQRAGLPMPQVAIAPHEQPNAFATGRSPEHAVVCVTQGLVQLVNRDEIEGVIAHEIGHIKNRDMLLQTLAATMAGAITNLARFGMYSPSEGRRGRPWHPSPRCWLRSPPWSSSSPSAGRASSRRTRRAPRSAASHWPSPARSASCRWRRRGSRWLCRRQWRRLLR